MGERLVLVERLQLGAQERDQVHRASRSADQDAHERLRPLGVGDDHLGLRGAVERLRVDVADHADDLPGIVVFAEAPQPAPDCLAAAQESVHEGLVDQDHGRRALVIR